MGFLIWWRKRGGVFWWTTILVILSIGTLVGVLVPVSRQMGHLDFRPPPDISATIEADKTSVSEGDTVTFIVNHLNGGGSEAGAVTVNIHLPDQLTATSVEPGTPACSQAGKLERFASQEAGQITGEPGGIMKCLLGTRMENSSGRIKLVTTVGEVASGDNLDVDVWLASYRTDTVAKDEFAWGNNCTSMTLVAGSGGSPTARNLDCSALGLIAQSLVLNADTKEAVPGKAFTLTASYENVPTLEEGEADTIVLDIKLPNELTANRLQQYNDDKALTEETTCSHPNQLEEFAEEGRGQVTNEPGGTISCIAGSRSAGALGRVRIETGVANAVSGSTIDVEVCARRELDSSAAASNCTMLALPVQMP